MNYSILLYCYIIRDIRDNILWFIVGMK